MGNREKTTLKYNSLKRWNGRFSAIKLYLPKKKKNRVAEDNNSENQTKGEKRNIERKEEPSEVFAFRNAGYTVNTVRSAF